MSYFYALLLAVLHAVLPLRHRAAARHTPQFLYRSEAFAEDLIEPAQAGSLGWRQQLDAVLSDWGHAMEHALLPLWLRMG